MTDWKRVEQLRGKGRDWNAIAQDKRVGFTNQTGTDPGRALKALYFSQKSRSQSTLKKRSAGGSTGRGPHLSRRMTMVLTVAVMVALLGGVLWFLVLSPTAPPPSVSTHEYLDSYCGGLPEDIHYHVLLVIMSNGVQQSLPSYNGQGGIGLLNEPGYTNSNYYCEPQGEHALHTHDGSGIIHIEMNSEFTVTPNLADFFAIWGEPLGSGQAWTFSGSMTATMLDMDTRVATSYSSDPGSIPLYHPPGGGTSNPYPIPQGWIFNGQYGDGSSGGYFDGEIIWLNVTTGASSAAAMDICHEGIPCAAPLSATCTQDGVSPIPERSRERAGPVPPLVSAWPPHICEESVSTVGDAPLLVVSAGRPQA